MTKNSNQSDKMAWGMTLLVFGALILLDKLGITAKLPFASFLQSAGTYFLSAGIIFLIYKREKTMGIVLSAIGVIIHSDLFFGWMHAYRSLLVPIALLVVGLILVLSNRIKK
ncbi:MAG: hypothetical protein GXZ03_00410 [Proteiniphilum sp.]|nr:hypothetical protein [Proteiniphilum sp.]